MVNEILDTEKDNFAIDMYSDFFTDIINERKKQTIEKEKDLNGVSGYFFNIYIIL